MLKKAISYQPYQLLGAFGLAFLLIAFSPALAQQSPIPSGEWEVRYADRLLGAVRGLATVKESGEITVSLTHPETEKTHTLKTTKVETDGNIIRLTLEGSSPCGKWQSAEDLPGLPVYVPEDKRTLKVSGEKGAKSATLKVEQRPETDINKVIVELEKQDDGSYGGYWRYRVDPLTGRDANGYGRVGELVEMADGIAYQQGLESWSHPKPKIYGALDVDKPSGANWNTAPLYHYPFKSDGQPISEDDFERRRYIIVYGKDFGWNRDKPVKLTWDKTQPISYEIEGYEADLTDYSGRVMGYDRDALNLSYRRGTARIKERLPKEKRGEVKDLNVLFLKANFKAGVAPGLHEFELDGEPVNWVVQFSNAKAEIAFVREIEQETDNKGKVTKRIYEETVWLYQPERFHIQIRTEIALPIKEIPLVFGINGKVQSIEGEPKLITYRSSWDPNLYLSKPLGLLNERINEAIEIYERFSGPRKDSDPDYVTPLTVTKGDKLHATLGHPGLIAANTPMVTAIIYDSPTESWDKPVSGEHVNPWRAALNKAAKYRKIKIRDWSKLPRQEVDTIWNVVITSFGVEDTVVRTGDYAAMLMLRRAFIEMMEQQYNHFGTIDTDAELLGQHDLIRRMKRVQSKPFRDIKVTGPKGGTVKYGYAVDMFNIDDDKVKAWKIKATREMVTKFRAAVKHSIDYAKGVNERKTEELLKLTGFGFDAVVAYLTPRLMEGKVVRVGDPAYQGSFSYSAWQPNRYARGWVKSLYVVANKVKDQQDLARIDKAFVLATSTAILLPFSWGTSAITARLVAQGAISSQTAAGVSAVTASVFLGLDLLDAAVLIGDEIPEYLERSDETEFALGASAVLGGGRYVVAKNSEKEWWEIAASIALVGLGNVTSTLHMVPEIYRWHKSAKYARSISAGEELIDNLKDIDKLRRLSLAQKTDLFNFLDGAKATQKAGGDGALTAVQLKGLKAYDEMQAKLWDLGDELPDWARLVHRRTLRALGSGLLRRDDIQELIRKNARSLESSLAGANRALALELMKVKPYRSIKQLRADIKAIKKRVTEPKEGFFAAADADRNFFVFAERGWEFKIPLPRPPDLNGFQDIKVFVRVADPKKPGEIITTDPYLRSYNPTTGQFVFDYAFRRKVPAWIPEAPVKLTSKGAPTTPVMNLMAMNKVGIGFAGSGKLLKEVKLSTVVNGQTVVQLGWLKHHFGGNIPEEAYRRLFSVGYAETTIQQAGYKIVGVSVHEAEEGIFSTKYGLESHYETVKKNFRDKFESEGLTLAEAEAKAPQSSEAFMKRYFGEDWRNLEDIEFASGSDIHIKVEPIR